MAPVHLQETTERVQSVQMVELAGRRSGRLHDVVDRGQDVAAVVEFQGHVVEIDVGRAQVLGPGVASISVPHIECWNRVRPNTATQPEPQRLRRAVRQIDQERVPVQDHPDW